MKTVAILLGDRYGVGPELVARLAPALRPDDGVRYVIVGDRRVFDHGGAVVGGTADVPAVASLEAVQALNSAVGFLDRPFAADVLPLSRVSADAGREVLDTWRFVLEAGRRGVVDGIVYAPLNKQAMQLAGHQSAEELDFFVRELRFDGPCGEINILGDLWTSRVTSHVALRAVGDLITRERVIAAIRLIAEAMRRGGRAEARIGVAALNPHAGEGGAFGREEIDIIAPAVAAAQAAGFAVDGPWPADTIFPQAEARGIGGVVTMFHDQGQIALKLLGLGRGVTLHAGLPVPIATPSHGTAFDIAGTGKARVDGLTAATDLVRKMALAPGA